MTPPHVEPTHLVANLAAERSWLQQRDGGPTQPAPALPRSALRRSAEFGSLLRVLATEGSTLWLPASLSAARLPPIPGVPEVELAVGSAPADTPGVGLAWAATGELAPVFGAAPSTTNEPWASLPSLARALWCAPRMDAADAARANHDDLRLELARSLGTGEGESDPAQTQVVASTSQYEAALTQFGSEPVLVKAPLTASGRDRFVVQPEARAAPATLRSVARLLAQAGHALIMPWRDRVVDLACTSVLLERGPAHTQVHELCNRPSGQFEGARLVPGAHPVVPPQLRSWVERFALAAMRRLERLHTQGIRGPVGIDGYVYRQDSTLALEPMCDLNVRMTMGWLLRLYAERLASRLPDAAAVCWTLHVGQKAPDAPDTPGAQRTCLLRPAANGPAAGAWILARSPKA